MSPYKAIQPRLCVGRRRGTGGGLRPYLYVKEIQKFLAVFSSDGSRGSKTCHWSAYCHRGASRDPLVRMDQDAEGIDKHVPS